MREAIASVIEARGGFAGSVVLDLFAGTGALAFEALSRGAARALLVDDDLPALRAIAESASRLGVTPRMRAVSIDLAREGAADRIAAEGCGPFDRVLVDPPYRAAALVPPLLGAIAGAGLLAPSALVLVEHGRGEPMDLVSPFEAVSRYRYGDTAVLLARWEEPGSNDRSSR